MTNIQHFSIQAQQKKSVYKKYAPTYTQPKQKHC